MEKYIHLTGLEMHILLLALSELIEQTDEESMQQDRSDLFEKLRTFEDDEAHSATITYTTSSPAYKES